MSANGSASNGSHAPGPAYAWLVNFSYGNTTAYYKDDPGHVRLVRSGQ